MQSQSNPRAAKRASPTLAEVAQARPRCASGAPPRSRSHYDAILELLREHGSQGVLGSELYDQPHLCGRSPRNRVSELRRDGFVISGQARGSSDWHYVLLPDSGDWYERERGPRPPDHPWKTPFSPKRQSEDFQLTPPEVRR
jgi:hypothetical protein